MSDKIYAGVELGGTKAIALIAKGTQIIAQTRISTTIPQDVLPALSDFLMGQYAINPFEALGIASFGPICLDKNNDKYGFITQTPKPNWSNTNILGAFSWFKGAIGFDTDVNGAGLAEGNWGAAQDSDNFIYITIGTGVGGGLIINKKPVHGFLHPEMGHIKIPRLSHNFKGICPFHNDCVEGLVSGKAIHARAQKRAEDIAIDDIIWQEIAQDIAQFLTNLMLICSPQKIIIGGGVMNGAPHLFPLVHKKCAAILNNYVASLDETSLAKMIIPPKLGDLAGPLGAIAVAKIA